MIAVAPPMRTCDGIEASPPTSYVDAPLDDIKSFSDASDSDGENPQRRQDASRMSSKGNVENAGAKGNSEDEVVHTRSSLSNEIRDYNQRSGYSGFEQDAVLRLVAIEDKIQGFSERVEKALENIRMGHHKGEPKRRISTQLPAQRGQGFLTGSRPNHHEPPPPSKSESFLSFLTHKTSAQDSRRNSKPSISEEARRAVQEARCASDAKNSPLQQIHQVKQAFLDEGGSSSSRIASPPCGKPPEPEDDAPEMDNVISAPTRIRSPGERATVRMVDDSGEVAVSTSFVELPEQEFPRGPADRSRQHRVSVASSGIGSVSAHDMARAIKVVGQNRSDSVEQVWRFLDDPESSPAAHIFSSAMNVFILACVVVTFLQTVEPAPISEFVAAVLETSFDIIFSIEILLRFGTSPSWRLFFKSPVNWIDALSIGSLALRASIGFTVTGAEKDTFSWMILMCVVPVLRILKMLRHFQTLQILLGAFILAAEALPVLLYMLLVITLVSSCIIYIVEPRDNIPTPATAVWLTIVTMTTVGYGDVTPQSPIGYIVVAVLLIASVLFMAMPLGIIGSAFNMTWSDRDRILLTQRTRQRLLQWGYTAEDVMVLFKFMDSDDDGALSLEDFYRLMRHMKIGLNQDRVAQLFHTFDSDGSGTVDAEEFVRVFFPTSFLDVFREMETHTQAQQQEKQRESEQMKCRKMSTASDLTTTSEHQGEGRNRGPDSPGIMSPNSSGSRANSAALSRANSRGDYDFTAAEAGSCHS